MTLICGADSRVRRAALALFLFLPACGRDSCRDSQSGLCASVRPVSGSGSHQVFQVTFSDPKGVADLQSVRVLVNDYRDGDKACFVYYDRPRNAFLLVHDSGQGSDRMEVGTTGSLDNNQCRLDGFGSSARAAGNSVTIRLNLTFHPKFYGEKQIFLASETAAGGTSSLETRGKWRVCYRCEPTDRPPSAVSVSPSSGASLTQVFTLVYAAPSGFSNLSDVRVLFSRGVDALNACYVRYDPEHDALRLADDDAAQWSEIGLKSGDSTENSQCRITAAGSSASGDGARLTLRLALTFKRAFGGQKNIYLFATERQGLAIGPRRKGTWVVPYASPEASQKLAELMWQQPVGQTSVCAGLQSRPFPPPETFPLGTAFRSSCSGDPL